MSKFETLPEDGSIPLLAPVAGHIHDPTAWNTFARASFHKPRIYDAGRYYRSPQGHRYDVRGWYYPARSYKAIGITNDVMRFLTLATETGAEWPYLVAMTMTYAAARATFNEDDRAYYGWLLGALKEMHP